MMGACMHACMVVLLSDHMQYGGGGGGVRGYLNQAESKVHCHTVTGYPL